MPTTSRRTSCRASQQPAVRPRPRLLGAVAERDDGLIVHKDLAPGRDLDQRPVRPQVQGQGRDADRDARHGAAGDEVRGRRPRRRRPSRTGSTRSTRSQDAVDSGQIRRFTGNDYARDLTTGDVVAVIGWSGDAVQLQADNPNIEFRMPDGGLHALVGQHGDPDRGPEPGRGRGVHELRLRPEEPGADRRRTSTTSPRSTGVKEILLEAAIPSSPTNQLIFPTEEFTQDCDTGADAHRRGGAGRSPRRSRTSSTAERRVRRRRS